MIWFRLLFVLCTALSAGLGCSGSSHAPLPQLNLQASAQGESNPSAPVSGQHPLDPALELARQVRANVEANVRDYTAMVIKRERIGSAMKPDEVCFVKVRHDPFSVYMGFLAPASVKGQEALYVEGANDGKMIAHAGSGLQALAGTVEIDPHGPIAMLGQRYPITELGIKNLARRLIEVGEHDRQYGECYVWINDDAHVGDRPCKLITVMHPQRRREFLFHVARIFVDKELQVPLLYEAYDWPAPDGDGKPVLLESYTYVDLKLNAGLTDADFDRNNPGYNFTRTVPPAK